MAQRSGQGAATFVETAGARPARKRRRRRRSDGPADQAEWKLHEPERLTEPAHWTIPWNTGGEICVHHYVDLNRRVAEYRGAHQPDYRPQSRMVPVEAGPENETLRAQRWQLPEQLQPAAKNHADRHAGDRTDAEQRPHPVTKCQPEDDGTYIR